MPNDTTTRIIGGSPLAVLGRLILVSILVGVILSALGLDPFDIVRSVERLIRSIWDMGFDAFRWLWRYFLLGAVIVIPIWLIMRLVNAPRGVTSAASAAPQEQRNLSPSPQQKRAMPFQRGREMFSKLTGSLIALFGVVTVYGFYIGGLLGWAYWMWMSFHLGSFMMFFFGILGPLAMIAAFLGLWAFLFGIPLWLLHLVH